MTGGRVGARFGDIRDVHPVGLIPVFWAEAQRNDVTTRGLYLLLSCLLSPRPPEVSRQRAVFSRMAEGKGSARVGFPGLVMSEQFKLDLRAFEKC